MSISPTFMAPGAQSALIATGRQQRARRQLVRALKPVHVWQFDEHTEHARAKQEAQLRRGDAPPLPVVFFVVGGES